MTSKLQVTIPKVMAEKIRIKPGDEVHWSEAGRGLLLEPHSTGAALDTGARLKLFDAVTRRLKEKSGPVEKSDTKKRGWTREELYTRGDAH